MKPCSKCGALSECGICPDCLKLLTEKMEREYPNIFSQYSNWLKLGRVDGEFYIRQVLAVSNHFS